MVHLSAISFAKRSFAKPTVNIATSTIKGARRTTETTVAPKRKPLKNLQHSPAQSSGGDITVRPSPLKIGTDFENRALNFLRDTLSMSLGRIGGPSDGGVDLQGWWWLPPLQGLPVSEENSVDSLPTKVTDLGRSIADAGRRRLRVLAQCKAESKPLGPHYIREMEGVLYGYLVSLPQKSSRRRVALGASASGFRTFQPSQLHPTIGMVVSQSAFTKSSINRVMASSVPLLLMHLPPLDRTESSAGERADMYAASLQWNPALGSEGGLLGGNLEIRWERESTGEAERGRPFMYWKGKRLENWIPQDTLLVPA